MASACLQHHRYNDRWLLLFPGDPALSLFLGVLLIDLFIYSIICLFLFIYIF